MMPWQRIARAVKRGTGLRLTADEVSRLGYDEAIMQRAWRDDEEDESSSKLKEGEQDV